MVMIASPLLLLALAVGLLPGDDDGPRVTPIVRVVRDVGPAVVNIYQEVAEEAEYPFPYNRLWAQRRPQTSLGSGFIIDSDGYILTNAHVIDADSSLAIKVRLFDGRTEPARLVDIDSRNDVALLKIECDAPLARVRLGSSADIMVGETVIAIGNPLGNENTVTTGIVSALFRDVRVTPAHRPQREAFRDFIQTDAPINPGNSGGPLLNVEGEVIGVNFAIKAEAQGIGFAIPIDRVRRSLIDELSDPRDQRDLITGMRLSSRAQRVRVTKIEDGGPAARAGLRVDDRVVSIRDQLVEWEFDFNKELLDARPGDSIPLRVERGTAQIDIKLILSADVSPGSYIWHALGLRVVDHPDYFGVRIEVVDPDGPSVYTPLLPGDLIDGIIVDGDDGRSVDTADDLYRILVDIAGHEPVLLQGFRKQSGFQVGPVRLASPD
jgi:serine protease Do